MLRQDREMGFEETAAALALGKWGVLSTWDGETPYGVPLNYVYSHEDRAVFLHCALKGKKLDNIAVCPSVSFAVVLRESVMPERFSTIYESVIVMGKASVVKDEQEKIKRLKQLCASLAPQHTDGRDEYINKYLSAAAVLRIDIEDISGKKNTD